LEPVPLGVGEVPGERDEDADAGRGSLRGLLGCSLGERRDALLQPGVELRGQIAAFSRISAPVSACGETEAKRRRYSCSGHQSRSVLSGRETHAHPRSLFVSQPLIRA
jgi:hypothetical protein